MIVKTRDRKTTVFCLCVLSFGCFALRATASAGPFRVADFNSAEPEGEVKLCVFSASEGTLLSEYGLNASPVFDGFAAYARRIYCATSDGRVVCYGAAQK